MLGFEIRRGCVASDAGRTEGPPLFVKISREGGPWGWCARARAAASEQAAPFQIRGPGVGGVWRIGTADLIEHNGRVRCGRWTHKHNLFHNSCLFAPVSHFRRSARLYETPNDLPQQPPQPGVYLRVQPQVSPCPSRRRPSAALCRLQRRLDPLCAGCSKRAPRAAALSPLLQKLCMTDPRARKVTMATTTSRSPPTSRIPTVPMPSVASRTPRAGHNTPCQ